MSRALTPYEQEYLDANSSSWQLVMASLLLGAIMDTLLLGIVICQGLYWKLHLERDERWALRLLIYWSLLGSLAHSCWNQAFAWSVFVTSLGDPLSVVRGVWIKGALMSELLLVIPIEMMYAHRAYQLWGRRKSLGAILSILICLCIALAIAAVSVPRSDPVGSTTSTYFIACAFSLLAIDWIVSALIVIPLVRKRSGMEHSDKLVMRIVMISAEAQVIPSLITLGLVVKVLVWPGSMMVVGFIFIPKVWVATALLVVNYRKVLRRDMEAERQRRQNTISLLQEEGDGNDSGAATWGSQGRTTGTIPTLSFGEPIISEKANEQSRSLLTTSPADGYLSVTIEDGRTSSVGGLTRFERPSPTTRKSPKLSDCEDELCELSFEEMLGGKGS